MNSSMIGKIEKARRYAQEPERLQINRLLATFRGGHDDYALALDQARWSCTCAFHDTHGVCAHVMAVQKMALLIPMLPEAARFETTPWPAGMSSGMIAKLEKARHYAQEPDRLVLTALEVAFRGSHADYPLTLRDNAWQCGCEFFSGHDVCAHVMAAQRLLVQMLPEAARVTPAMATAAV